MPYTSKGPNQHKFSSQNARNTKHDKLFTRNTDNGSETKKRSNSRKCIDFHQTNDILDVKYKQRKEMHDMKRDAEKDIAERKRKFVDAFGVDDIKQIIELSQRQTKENPYAGLEWNYISNGLDLGYMVGYRKGLRDAKKKAKK